LWTKPNSLVDSFVAVLKHALTNYHHGCIEPEEAKALPITAFIQPRSSATSCRSSRNSFLPMPDAPHSEARPVPLLHLCLPETSIGVPCACRPRPNTVHLRTFWMYSVLGRQWPPPGGQFHGRHYRGINHAVNNRL
jgi:hypothetical protein